MIRFTADHEWVRVEDNVAVVGITNHAQDALGDITYVELPPVGNTFAKGDVLCVVESVKAASDVFMPFDGKVSEVNTVLDGTPELINNSAESEGWICKIIDFTLADFNDLMDSQAYNAMLANQE